jgi:hypothetical protein
MRVIVMIEANKDTEAGVMPSQQLLEEMGKFNEELVKAGVMLSCEGLHPSPCLVLRTAFFEAGRGKCRFFRGLRGVWPAARAKT